MPLVYADRVQETSSSIGLGDMVLIGAAAGFRSFTDGIGDGNETYYTIINDADSSWEVGRGTFTFGTLTLSRDTVYASSNSNNPVNFAAGTKTVFATVSALFFGTALDATGHAALDHTGIPGVGGSETFTAAVHTVTDHTGLPGVNDFDSANHALTDHTGLPGVPAAEAFTSGVHAATDHTGLPGVPSFSEKQRIYLPESSRSFRLRPNPNPSALYAQDALLDEGGFPGIVHDRVGTNVGTASYTQDADGNYVEFSGSGSSKQWRVESNFRTFNARLPRLIANVAFTLIGGGINQVGEYRIGFWDPAEGGYDPFTGFTTQTEAIALEAFYTTSGTINGIRIKRRVGGVTLSDVDTGIVGNAGPYYFVIEYIGQNGFMPPAARAAENVTPCCSAIPTSKQRLG